MKVLKKMWAMLMKGTSTCTKACACLLLGGVAGALLQHHYHLTDIVREWLNHLLA